jgi:hypothetical protein
MGQYDNIKLEVHDYTDEERRNYVDKTTPFMNLIQWMYQNFDSIFEKAPKMARYAVGVHRESEEPEIHYFRHRIRKGALNFMREQDSLDKITYLLYRNEEKRNPVFADVV